MVELVDTEDFGNMVYEIGLITHTTIDKVVPNKYQVKSAQTETSDVEAG